VDAGCEGYELLVVNPLVSALDLQELLHQTLLVDRSGGCRSEDSGGDVVLVDRFGFLIVLAGSVGGWEGVRGSFPVYFPSLLFYLSCFFAVFLS